ncbi:DUF2345 domain-containing protein, partial [Iodobacter sp. CM08]|uniref:DUF2345 domain-containing protein n=1 Tax=Iodobacter sp. CM08 TaxID=3085902 RepID=UPI002981F774
GQYGELLFDDTQGEVRTKLSSEHGKTQLNLGYLIHPRTDGKASTGHLYHHVHASKSLEAGSNTDQDGKSKSKDQTGQQKIILLHGEDGIAITSPQSQTLSAGTNLDQIAQRDTNQTSGRRWIHNVGQHISLFVAGVKDKVALKLIAAKGKIQLQAQSDDIEITADKNVKLTAIKGKGLFNAKQEILLTAGGAYIRIKDGKIELHAPGKVSIKGGSHDWGGPASLTLPNAPFNLADLDKKSDLEILYEDADGNSAPAGEEIKLIFGDGKNEKIALDESGKATVKNAPWGVLKAAQTKRRGK